MPEYAKSYDIADMSKVPTIDGIEIPWYISADRDARPMVEAQGNGECHILWLPVMVDAPMPTPPEGHPDGHTIEVRDGLGDLLRTVSNGGE